MEEKCYFVLEGWIGPEHAWGTHGFWTQLEGPAQGIPWRTESEEEALATYREHLPKHREGEFRLVRITHTVVATSPDQGAPSA